MVLISTSGEAQVLASELKTRRDLLGRVAMLEDALRRVKEEADSMKAPDLKLHAIRTIVTRNLPKETKS